jgi:hypothetical protein
MLSVPKQLVPMVEELSNLYGKEQRDQVIAGLCSLVAYLKGGISSSDGGQEEELQSESYLTFLKSWQEILDVQVYVDTDIYGTLDLEAISEGVNCISEPQMGGGETDSPPNCDRTDKAWPEVPAVAGDSTSLPDDLFIRSWTTPELSKLLGCTASNLRKAKKENRLPVKIGNFLIDCIDPECKKILWRVSLNTAAQEIN